LKYVVDKITDKRQRQDKRAFMKTERLDERTDK
jgi:hypothetical protein